NRLALNTVDVAPATALDPTCAIDLNTDSLVVGLRMKSDSRVTATLGSPQSFEESEQPKQATPGKSTKRLEVPADLPCAGSPRYVLPPTTAPLKDREAALAKLFPPLPALPIDP